MEQTGCALKWANGRLTVLVRGEVDHHSAKGLREEIDHAMYLYRPEILARDLSSVDFMDSSGIGVIMGRYKQMQYAGGEVFVCGIGKNADRIFQMSGLYRLVKEYRPEREGGY